MLIRLTTPGEEQVSKPDKGKKRKNEALTESPESKKPEVGQPRTDAKVLTLSVAASLHEDDDNGDCPLVQRVRRSVDGLQTVGQKASESGMADVDQTHAKETLEEGLGAVLEPQVGPGIVRASKPWASSFRGPESEIFWGREETL